MEDADRDALAGVILGVVGLFVLPLVASVPAVYFGRRARGSALADGRSTSLATVAVVLGWLGIALGVLALLGLLLVVGGDVA
jgi:hypothetical protein